MNQILTKVLKKYTEGQKNINGLTFRMIYTLHLTYIGQGNLSGKKTQEEKKNRIGGGGCGKKYQEYFFY